MMNHNPAYYESLLTGWGLQKAKDLYAWWFDNSFDMVTRWAKRAQRLADRAASSHSFVLDEELRRRS